MTRRKVGSIPALWQGATMRILALAAALLVPSSALAGGLFTPDTGIVGLGRGGANVARADDLVSGLYYNPAGLWQLDGLSVQGGVHLLRTNVWFERAGGEGVYNIDDSGALIEGSLDEPFPRTQSLPYVRPIPEGGVAFGFDRPNLTIALGVYAPIAPIQAWPRYSPARYRVTTQELIQGNISLSAGWRIWDWLAVGASFQLLLMQLNEQFAASADFLGGEELDEDPQWDVLTTFSADSIRPHFNVGVMVMLTPWLRIAASFEPPYRFEGKGSLRLSGAVGEDFFEGPAGQLLDGDGPVVVEGTDEVDLQFGMPGRLRVGVGIEPVPDVFEVELDFHVELWRGSGDIVASGISVPLFHVGDDVDGPVPLDEYLETRNACGIIDCSTAGLYEGAGGTGIIADPASFRSTWSVRLGGSVTPLPALRLRFGGLYEAPATTEENLSVIMLDSHKFVAGGGLSFRPWAGDGIGPPIEIHVSYAHVFYLPRTVDAGVSKGRTHALEGVPTNPIDAGRYGGSADMVGLSVAAHFGRMAERAKAAKAGPDPS
jgi:long-chain fatty acid transport protein